MLTDPVWWFYLTWLPSYLQRERGVTLASAAGALLVIYLAADLGSVFGGWLPAFFLRRGWSGTRARLATMALFAAGLPISALGVMAQDLWTAVAFISIATACHQAWSANMFTVASDAFPNRAVGSVVGFGGMCGGIGGMLMLLVAGGMLQWLGNFTPLFIFAGVMHPSPGSRFARWWERTSRRSTSTRASGPRRVPRSSRWAWGSWPRAPRSPRSSSRTGATSCR
jgi:MFS transporter, ACS family, hexuronate transporter